MHALTMETMGSTIFASTPHGIFQSTDTGKTWQTGYLDYKVVNTFYVNGTTLFAGINSYLMSSSDKGKTWSDLTLNLPGGAISSVTSVGSSLLVGLRSYGIFALDDTSDSWSRRSKGLTNSDVTSLLTIDSVVLAATANSYNDIDGFIYRLAYGSDQWIRVGPTGVNSGILFAMDTVVFAGSKGVVYRSADKGLTWTEHRTGLPDAYITTFAAMGQYLFAGTENKGLYVSLDSGTTWSAAGLAGGYIRKLVVMGDILIAGTIHEGVLVSRDRGKTWESSYRGLLSTAIVTILAAHHNELYACVANDGRVHYSDNSGASWVIGGPIPKEISSMVATQDACVVGTYGNGIFISGDHGLHWEKPEQDVERPFVTALAVIGSTIIAGTASGDTTAEHQRGVFYSHDNGKTWISSNLHVPIEDITVYGSKCYAATYLEGIFVSSDSGRTWTSIGEEQEPFSFLKLAYNGEVFFGATRYMSVLKVSSNNGKSWELSRNGFPSFEIHSPTFAVAGKVVFLGIAGGLFISNDNGALWTRIDPPLTDEPLYVEDLIIANGYLYMAAKEASIWRRPLSDFGITSVSPASTIMNPYVLTSHPLTSASVLQLPDTCQLRGAVLELSTLTGQQIHRIENLYGTSVVIERNNLIAGVYVFTLTEAGQVIASGTIVVK